MPERPGYALPLLLLGAFRGLIEALHAELARCGHAEARPVHGFALQAIGRDGASVSELGRRLGVSKQAAAKTAAGLQRLGYVVREPDPADARAVRLRRTSRGEDMLQRSAEIFEGLREELVERLGAERLETLEESLELLFSAQPANLGDVPGWLR